MASSASPSSLTKRVQLQHQIHVSSDDLLISSDEDMDSNVTLAWKQVWKTDSYDNLFQGLLEPQISCQENKIRGYIDPDTIHCPLLLQDSSLEKVHHAKTFWSRTPSVLSDIDFDYGTEIGRAPEEWPNISGDTDSVFETTAISLENFLLSSTMFSEAEAILKRRAKLIDQSTTNSSGNTSRSVESEPVNNSSSVQDSVERNREYFENLARIYQPDTTYMSAQVIPDRCRSEESTPDLKKGNGRRAVVATAAAIAKRGGNDKLLKKEYRKLIRRRTSPGFFYRDASSSTPVENPPSIIDKFKQGHKMRHMNSFMSSKAMLRRSMSSLDFNINHGSLVAVAEIEDEPELSLPYEPHESSSLMRTMIQKGVIADGFIKGIKKAIVFKEEAKDEVSDLPKTQQFKRNSRMVSPEPQEYPREMSIDQDHRMTYKELNRFGLTSASMSMLDNDDNSDSLASTKTIGGVCGGQAMTSVSPILGNRGNEALASFLKRRSQRRPKKQRFVKPKTRLPFMAYGYLEHVHAGESFQGYLDIQLEEDLEHLKIMDSLEEGNDHRTMLLKRSGRFDSSACLIVPNEYRIPPNPENCM